MKVVINQREVEYTSDYPDGWKFSAGDPFKFPVLIGDHACFIKRFEQRGPEDISGWELIVKLTGRFEKNLSRIYDIKNVQENGKEIYYVFYEYLEGTTLDRCVEDASIDLMHLNSDLFTALRALQKYEFWFADFFEKNIFCQKDGTFVLVDLDSTQRIADLPDNEMYGSKDYWILVLKFCKETLNKNDLRLSDINGITLNYLQIPFLILRLKLFLSGDREDYNSTVLFNQLPSRLYELAPGLRDIYANIISNRRQPLSAEEARKIEDIVEDKIIKAGYVGMAEPVRTSLPVITAFTTTKTAIGSGGSFILSWQTENATRLELYKNGAKFKSLETNQKEIELKEFADGTRQQSAYQLVAYRELDMAKSEPLTITLREERAKPNKKKIAGVLLGLAALAVVSFLLYYLIYKKDTLRPYIGQRILRQGADSTLTIYGEDLPAADKIIVLLNKMAVGIEAASGDSLVILLPKTSFADSNDVVSVMVNFNDKRYDAGSFLYLPKIVMRQADVYEDSTVILYGENLHTGNIKVLLDNKEIAISSRSGRWLAIKMPELEDTVSPGDSVQMQVVKNENIVFTANLTVKYDTVNLTDLTPESHWVEGEIRPDGTIRNGANLPWPGDSTSPAGFVRIDEIALEDGNSYRALRTHPTWIPNGSISGFSPLEEVRGKKTFKSQVGFVQNGRSLDGVNFQVWVYYDGLNKSVNIIDLHKNYDGNLTNLAANLPDYVQNEFSVELRVNAGSTSNSDWAAWINPIVISRRLVVSAERQ